MFLTLDSFKNPNKIKAKNNTPNIAEILFGYLVAINPISLKIKINVSIFGVVKFDHSPADELIFPTGLTLKIVKEITNGKKK